MSKLPPQETVSTCCSSMTSDFTDPDYDISLDDADYEYDYDYYESDYDDSSSVADCCASVDGKGSLKTSTKGESSSFDTYILGTLIVRVVQARDLPPFLKPTISDLFFGNRTPNRNSYSGNNNYKAHKRQLVDGPANIHARIRFNNQIQNTSHVHNQIDPTWPRGEESYFDVSLPVSDLAQEADTNDVADPSIITKPTKCASSEPPLPPPPPPPTLLISLYHTPPSSPSILLGTLTIPLTPLLTGKTPASTTSLPLSNPESRGHLRVALDYEPTDPPPNPGDLCRFTSLCPAVDLYPLTPSQLGTVEEVRGDDVTLSWMEPEGWRCFVTVHRYSLICARRHQAATEKCVEYGVQVMDRVVKSPLVRSVSEVLGSVEEEGLVDVGGRVLSGGWGLVGRWMGGGVERVVGDVVYATNWDGRSGEVEEEGILGGFFGDGGEGGEDGRCGAVGGDDDLSSTAIDEEVEEDVHSVDAAAMAGLGMPCCPITGQPMKNPVVAADGHTYEKSAIARWLRTSDRSPLTGEIMTHKNLVPNYLLLSSI